MRAIMIILAVFCAFTAKAQDSAIKISYNEKAPRYDRAMTWPNGINMILIADANSSFYYNSRSQYIDSLESTAQGRKTLREMLMASLTSNSKGRMSLDLTKENAPIKQIKTFISKNHKEHKIRYHDRVSGGYQYYDEPFHEMKWNIVGDSIISVLGYECVMALTDYHGRTWKAWFAPDIPIQDGPWKLHGLPGVILKAESGDFSFIATGLEHFNGIVPGIYNHDRYEKTNRLKYLSDYLYFKTHEDEIALAQGVKLKHIDGDGKEYVPSEFDPYTYMLEIDFIKNRK